MWGRAAPLDAVRPWLARHGLAGGTRVHAYPQRPSQAEKARLVAAAQDEILELGVALNTCANYLVTRERPASYRDAVTAFLARGGRYRCVVTTPDSAAAVEAGHVRQEDIPAKVKDSLAKLHRYKSGLPRPAADRLEVYGLPTYPGLAAFAVDPDDTDALVLYSPYVTAVGPDLPRRELADMAHYLVGRADGPMFDLIVQQLRQAAAAATRLL
jgi:hypothetical protein